MTPSSSTPDAALQGTDVMDVLADLNSFFRSAEAALQENRIIDMGGIDTRVAEVCRTVQTATPEEQEKYLPELTILINRLDSYEHELTRFQGALMEKVQQEIDKNAGTEAPHEDTADHAGGR